MAEINTQELLRMASTLRTYADRFEQLANGGGEYIPEDKRRAMFISKLMYIVEAVGGRIPSEKLLVAAQNMGYSRHGVGGFYGKGAYLTKTEDGYAVLHEDGKKQLRKLRDQWGLDD